MKIVPGLISVIVPVYNRQEFVDECIASVQAQSYQSFEIIIVDDGSTDNTYDICTALAEKDQRIKLFAADHGGVSAARNRALEEASGEYVFFLDSDDVIHPFLFETLVSGMKSNNAAIGATDLARVTSENWYKVRERLEEANGLGETVFITAEEVISTALEGKCSVDEIKGYRPLSLIGGMMMRRDLIGDTVFNTDLFIGEDFYFIYQNIIKGASCVVMKQRWYYERIHGQNSSWNFSYEACRTRFCRRRLVWESEEALGRKKYADIQKHSALSCVIMCMEKHRVHSAESKKMRKLLRDCKSAFKSCGSFEDRLIYILIRFFPATALLLFKMKRKLKRSARKGK